MSDLEKRSNESEVELFQVKNKNSALEEELKQCKMRNVLLTEKIAQYDKHVKAIKGEMEILSVKLVGKRNKLQTIRDNLFQSTIHWRICEEKLKQIEEA